MCVRACGTYRATEQQQRFEVEFEEMDSEKFVIVISQISLTFQRYFQWAWFVVIYGTLQLQLLMIYNISASISLYFGYNLLSFVFAFAFRFFFAFVFFFWRRRDPAAYIMKSVVQ